MVTIQPSSTALASLCLWHGCVEKFGDHRGQPLGAVRERHMRCAGEHGKLGTRQADEIAYYTAAEQAKHLYNVLRAHDIGVPNRKSTRLNSSHLGISYAVFCLKKK